MKPKHLHHTLLTMTVFIIFIMGAASFTIVAAFSPLNASRPLKREIHYIILHSTEGTTAGAMEKLRQYGEAHYLIDTDGTIFQLMSDEKLADHAGRSLWNGEYDLNWDSIGIEVVGYHYITPTQPQLNALKGLLNSLKEKYHIDDNNVLTHSMVAYGVPNGRHRADYRGRKACGMLMATREVREELGLSAKPLFDPDVQSGKVIVGDKELFGILFAKNEREERQNYLMYIKTHSLDGPINKTRINQIENEIAKIDKPEAVSYQSNLRYVDREVAKPDEAQVTNLPDGFQEITESRRTAYSIAGHDYGTKRTIYFFPNGFVATGEGLLQSENGKRLLSHLPLGTKMLIGYVWAGHAGQGKTPDGTPIVRTAYSIVGQSWNSPSTYYYRFSDRRIFSGEEIDEKSIGDDMLIFFQR